MSRERGAGGLTPLPVPASRNLHMYVYFFLFWGKMSHMPYQCTGHPACRLQACWVNSYWCARVQCEAATYVYKPKDGGGPPCAPAGTRVRSGGDVKRPRPGAERACICTAFCMSACMRGADSQACSRAWPQNMRGLGWSVLGSRPCSLPIAARLCAPRVGVAG